MGRDWVMIARVGFWLLLVAAAAYWVF